MSATQTDLNNENREPCDINHCDGERVYSQKSNVPDEHANEMHCTGNCGASNGMMNRQSGSELRAKYDLPTNYPVNTISCPNDTCTEQIPINSRYDIEDTPYQDEVPDDVRELAYACECKECGELPSQTIEVTTDGEYRI